MMAKSKCLTNKGMNMKMRMKTGLSASVVSVMAVMLMGVGQAGAVNQISGQEFSTTVEEISSLTFATIIGDFNGAKPELGSGGNKNWVKIGSGTVNHNDEAGWQLTVVSVNGGILKNVGVLNIDQIVYTNIKMFGNGSGVLGSGADAWDVNGEDVTDKVAGGVFHTGEVTTATVAYGFDLLVKWDEDDTLLSGTYSDTITLTLAVDSTL